MGYRSRRYRSVSIENVSNCGSDFKVLVFTQRTNMLLYHISNAWFLVFLSNISLHLHTDLSNVSHWLSWCSDYQVNWLLKKSFSMDRYANLFQRVYGSYFEVEARIFGEDITQFGDEAVDPGRTKCFTEVWYFWNSHCTNRWYSVFKVVQKERLKVFREKVIVLNKSWFTWTLMARSAIFLMS